MTTDKESNKKVANIATIMITISHFSLRCFEANLPRFV